MHYSVLHVFLNPIPLWNRCHRYYASELLLNNKDDKIEKMSQIYLFKSILLLSMRVFLPINSR